LNDKIDWWYVAVGCTLSIPIVIAFGMAIYWIAEDSDGTRVAMQSAAILVIISVALLAAWNACYFALLYKEDDVATGNDGIGYITVTVKQQVVFSLWIAAVVCAFFAYYCCVLAHYKELYRKQQIADWLKAHGEDAKAEGFHWSHEDDVWPPLTAAQQKDKDEKKAEEKRVKDAKKKPKKEKKDDKKDEEKDDDKKDE